MHHRLDEYMEDSVLLGVLFRPGDVALLVQPNLLNILQMRAISAEGVAFLVPGHDPISCTNEDQLRAVRRLKPIGVPEVEKSEKRGRRPVWPVLSEAQVQTVVGLWHTEGMTPAAITERVREMVDAEVPKSWVRDQVIKATGSAARRPQKREGDNG